MVQQGSDIRTHSKLLPRPKSGPLRPLHLELNSCNRVTWAQCACEQGSSVKRSGTHGSQADAPLVPSRMGEETWVPKAEKMVIALGICSSSAYPAPSPLGSLPNPHGTSGDQGLAVRHTAPRPRPLLWGPRPTFICVCVPRVLLVTLHISLA